MKNQINISNLTPEEIEDLKQLLKAFDEQPKTIMDRVKSWEDAGEVLKDVLFYWVNSGSKILECGDTGILNDWQNKNLVPSEKHAKSILATSQLMVIAEALNEGWKPDYNNDNNKYHVKYNYDIEIGFSIDFWVGIGMTQIVFKSEELAEYAIRQFKELWYDYFMIDKPE